MYHFQNVFISYTHKTQYFYAHNIISVTMDFKDPVLPEMKGSAAL